MDKLSRLNQLQQVQEHHQIVSRFKQIGNNFLSFCTLGMQEPRKHLKTEVKGAHSLAISILQSHQ